MIVTHLENLDQQLAMNLKFARALEFLRSEGWRGQPDGTIEIDGKDVYALLATFETEIPQPMVRFEGHRKYADIMFLIQGTETIYWMQTNHLTPTTPYNEATDRWYSQAPHDEAMPLVLTAGQSAVFFPSDAHAPSHAAGNPERVRKITVKVAV